MNISRRRVSVALTLAIAMTSCTDGLAPRDAHRDATSGLSPSAHGILGGEAALEALGQMVEWMTAHGQQDDVPADARAVLENVRGASIRARGDLLPSAMPNLMLMEEGVSGPYLFNGVTYYEKGGELYPPVGTPARILKAYTTGTLSPGLAKVNAGFEFEGHIGTQATSWTVSNSRTGEEILAAKHDPFGSRTSGFFSAVKTFSGHTTIQNLPACDTRLEASTNHKAAVIGGWSVGEITINTEAQVGIRIEQTGTAPDYRTSQIYPAQVLNCPEPDPENCDTAGLDQSLGSVRDGALFSLAPTGSVRFDCGDDVDGGEGGFSDEYDCTICQQWFTVYRGKIVAEWWECYGGQGTECLAS